MRIGLQVINFDWENIGQRLAEIARTADDSGFYSLWVMDHFFQMGGIFGAAESNMLEGYSTISYLAGVTRRIKLGVLATGNIYREPGLMIKSVTTLDVLSGGRAYLGIGAGWYEREAKGLGLPFPSLKERFERLEETLQIAHQMWRDDPTPFHGKYYQLAEPVNHPQPVSRPHPPILIGGGGEKKTLRLVAKYGDACNLFLGMSVEDFRENIGEIKRKLDILEQHCTDVERDYNAIEKTVLATADFNTMTADQIVETCHSLSKIGVQQAIFNMTDVHTLKPLEIFAQEIIPVVSGATNSESAWQS